MCDLHESESVGGKHFHMNGFRTKTRFDTEAIANSEMAHSNPPSVLCMSFQSLAVLG